MKGCLRTPFDDQADRNSIRKDGPRDQTAWASSSSMSASHRNRTCRE